jgi:flagellin
MALNAETTQLKNEIDRIATTSSFAGSKLLDGNFINKNFQIGSGSGETLAVNISSAKTGAIGSNAVDTVAQVGATTATTANIKTAGAFTVAGTVGATQVTFAAGSSVKTVAAAVNAASSSTGVTAQASTTAKISIGQTGTTTFNLKSISGTDTGSAAISASIVSISDLTTLRDAINNVSGTTGITAAFDGADKSLLVLSDADGDDIVIADVDTDNSATTTTSTLSVTAMDFDGSATVGTTKYIVSGAGTNDVVVNGTMRMDSTASFSVTGQLGKCG